MKFKYLFTALILMTITSCTAKQPESPQKAPLKQTIHKAQKDITSWAYWLQAPSIAGLAESPYDLIVMDYSADGTDSKKFTTKDISVLHKFDKTVLCYFSIGEAEEYRFYWQNKWKDNPPNFLGPENPDWPANYKVRYWREDWWETGLRPYLDRILEAGFDGVYLDIIDGYWFWHEQGVDIESAADDMVKLIKRIADYCRAKSGKDFIICPQNGLGVIADCSPVYRDVYFKTVNMVGLESLLTNVFSKEDQNYRLSLAKELSDSGITILDVEYIKEDQYPNYLKKVKALNFPIIPYGATPDAALDTLTDFDRYRRGNKGD
ncbi:MJ1477/TM1410 family putative glycoside hydrolase [Maridesulfovibrio ferrireducens]|uniref:MJ1477/TM1410 family putative glycoside hydrolase n=1 Tax=Maridesulfovibrio ferrireducens TaxID=246191 RepID=UPI0034E93B90